MRTVLLSAAILTAATTVTATSANAERGMASFYGGRGARSGELVCAHKTRAMGSILTVRHGERAIRCRVTDRGPFIRGRVVDVSTRAARALGMMRAGVVQVTVE